MIRETDGNWWDSLGKPQYGGEIAIRANRNIVNFDPYFTLNLTTIHSAWLERLFTDDWTLNPAVFDYKTSFRPNLYIKGQLAESWEFINPCTLIVHLRKGVHWQDLPPLNGREFIARDVVFHFNRMCGLGGFPAPNPLQSGVNLFNDMIEVTDADNYTVVFKWNTANPHIISEILQIPGPKACIEAYEAVEKWGDLKDWHHAVGTGPFILKDFVSGDLATLIKNPNYWGYDERFPQNKLPYIDRLKFLIIPDDSIALDKMSSGNIDLIYQISSKQAQIMRKRNPEILQIPTSPPPAFSIDPRVDKAPFNDIRVRKAMQMAIDLPAIAESYYKGDALPYPTTLASMDMKKWGFGFPYAEWPQDLKDEYTYNPVASRKLLSDAGYFNGFKTLVVADVATDIGLLKIAKSYFADIGIDMEIQPMESAEWVAFVMINHQNDQLVNYTAGPFGQNCSPLFQLSRFSTGSPLNYQMISDPVLDRLNTKANATTSEDSMKRVFRDADEYIARQHLAVSFPQPIAYSLCQPWLKGFNAQFASVWTPASGPGLLSFYLARFWIDQRLKKSMGH
jgi:peptide/nickel transport system substrate-binding protein